jgi:hypothetical protein
MPEPVGLHVQRRDPLERLSSLLSVQRSRTALQVEQQEQRQKSALASYDWNRHVGADGTIDVPSLNDPELMSAAGDQYQSVVQSAISMKERQLAAQQSLVNLRSSQRSEFATMMNALRSDPDVVSDTPEGRQKVTQAMVNFGEIHGEDALPVLKAYAPFVQASPSGKLRDTLRNIGLQGASIESQLGAQQPVLTDTGAELRNINPNAIPTDPIAKELAPGAEILTDAKGAQFVFDRQTNTVTPVGQAAPPRGVPAPPSAPPSAPSLSFTQPQFVGQPEAVKQNQEYISRVRTAADAVPERLNNSGSVINILDSGAETGPLVSRLQSLGFVGQFTGDKIQEMQKYLARDSIAAMAEMGGSSDARLDAAAHAMGTTEFNPKVLREIATINSATARGLSDYRQGLEIAAGGDKPDYSSPQIPLFRREWQQNADLTALRVQDALARGKEDEARALLKDLEPAKRAAIGNNLANLESLTETGRLPQ